MFACFLTDNHNIVELIISQYGLIREVKHDILISTFRFIRGTSMKYYRARTGRARRRLAAILCSTAACTWSCAGQCQNASSGNAETYPSTSAARTNDTGNAPLG